MARTAAPIGLARSDRVETHPGSIRATQGVTVSDFGNLAAKDLGPKKLNGLSFFTLAWWLPIEIGAAHAHGCECSNTGKGCFQGERALWLAKRQDVAR